MEQIRLCKCGCGKEITIQPHHKYYGIPVFIRGHNPSWITGKKGYYKHTEEWKEKARKRMLGKNNPFYGKTHTKESLSKIKLFCKGDVSLRKGVKLSKEEKERLRNLRLGVKHSKETIKKILRRRTPSSLELKMIDIIEKHNLPYKFVGDGNFFIERKNPDFININGKKIAIEVFYKKHKEVFAHGLENWKQKREQIFNKYGWTLLFFDETQVNDNIAEILQ